jgi:hypothetical protein
LRGLAPITYFQVPLRMTVTLAEIIEIAEGLRDCTFPVARFHHREHCLAAAYFLKVFPGVDWRSEFPQFIRRYNVAMGGANTEDAGYHETITQFYIDAIEAFLRGHADGSVLDACRALLQSPIVQPDFALRFYSRQRLFSREARRRYLEPDLGGNSATGLP